MAMRRRIKVAVNLTSARKPKSEPPDHTVGGSVSVKVEPIETSESQYIKKEQAPDSFFSPQITPKAELQTELTSDKNAFKCPPKVEFNRSNSYAVSQSTDVSQLADIDDGVQVMQMDLQKSSNSFSMSPLKTQRQRIKPTPVFGQRRNSFVGTPISTPLVNDDVEQAVLTPRRERHFSGSQSSAIALNSNNSTGRTRTESTSSLRREKHFSGSLNAGTLSNFTPSKSMGRIRTESTCSVYSDSHLSTVSKSRKTDDHHNSQRWNLRREFEARFSNGVPDKSALKMADLIYYNPVTNPMEQKPKITEIKAEMQDPEPEPESENTKEEDNSAIPVPQLKLNAKGELILDDKSLEIETTAEQEARKVLAKSSLIFLDENTGMNGFYKRHKRTREWPPEETIRFYRCLQTIGTDFSMMCQLFPMRTRRDLKLKFKKEERCNAALINKAILHPNSFDIQELKDQFDVEDKEREEEEKEKAREKEMLAKKEYKKVSTKSSKAARALKNAQDAYNLCEGHLVKEGEPAKKKTKKVSRKKTIKKTDVENPDEETTNKMERTRRKPRKTKKANMNNEQDQQQHCNTESLEPTMKIEQEFISEDAPETTYPVCLMSSLEENLITPDPIQQQFSMLVEDEESEAEAGHQIEHIEAEQQSNFHHYSTDDETPRTFVNLDSGDLTQVTEKKSLHSDLTKQQATLLRNDSLYAERYSEKSEEEFFSIGTNYEESKITETCDIKPAIDIEKQKVICSSESSRTKAPTPSSPLSPPVSQTHNEMAIQQILEDIASGTLQVVSSYEPDAPDEIVTEIFMVDPKSGDLCDEPLDLPNELVQSILAVMI